LARALAVEADVVSDDVVVVSVVVVSVVVVCSPGYVPELSPLPPQAIAVPTPAVPSAAVQRNAVRRCVFMLSQTRAPPTR
jgi:hypothetical protein